MALALHTQRICLEVACEMDCDDFAGPLYLQLSGGDYDRCSTLILPDWIEDWRAKHRTARKRAARAARLGYTFDRIEREQFSGDVWEINTSLSQRQGRPMTRAYRTRQELTRLPAYPCDRHAIRAYGVLSGRTLVAYLWLYRCGDLALVSTILGHGDHLRNDVMYLLVAGAIEQEIEHGFGVMVYNRHDSGTDGLRFFKERLGFRETAVEWAA